MTSRLPGFYALSLEERRQIAAEALGIEVDELAAALRDGGMDAGRADKCVENVIGTYALPFALGLNVRMNDVDHLAPMAIEEPSVVAAASHASKIIREGGGFVAESDPPWMIGQVQLDGISHVERAVAAIENARSRLIEMANDAVPNLVARGGGAVDIEARDLGDGWLAVHVIVDCRDAMGANLVNTVAECLAEPLAELTCGRAGLRILSNLADRRTVRVRCAIPAGALEFDAYDGADVCRRIARASEFASRDPYRAATHNKGIMNGIDAVAIATGNDWRAVEAGAHAYAAREGRYGPLCRWRFDADRGDDGALVGELELPLALGIVGGTSRVHRGAQLGVSVAEVSSAQELAMLAACVGMATNLAALRALATDGIQRGHMALHARGVAIAAGARGAMVERVAARIVAERTITLTAARRTVARLRAGGPPPG